MQPVKTCLASQDCFVNLVLVSTEVAQVFLSKIFVFVVSVADLKVFYYYY